MYEKEKQRSIHLMVLLFNTIFIIALIVGSVFLRWEMGAVVLLILGLIASWVVHITETSSESNRLLLYSILTMLAFFFYGIHEIAIDDLAPVMMVFIIMYTVTENRRFVRFCTITFYLTMCYDFVFLLGNPLKIPIHTMSRLIFHFVIVFIAERFAEEVIRRRTKEKEKAKNAIMKLEETNRGTEDFLANVSHELRTPINAVTGITTVMLKNEEDPDKKKDIISIQMAGNRLFSQIEDILDYTEIDTGRVIVSEENYMIFSIINDIIVENRLTKWNNELEVIFDIDAGIPSILLGDGRKIKRIIKHLIDNAVKFTKKGGVYVRVYALQKSYGINLCITVSDTGIGMTEEELEKITDRFFQVNGGRNRKAGGLGLGIPIVYGMVSAMDGFIRLESTEGSGTTVYVSIPQKVIDEAPSMEVPNGKDLCIGLYLRPEKYEVPEIRDYYNATITHLVQGLDLMVHRVFDSEELKKLVDMYQLTHLVIGKEEYEESVSYYEAIDKEIEIIVVSDDDLLTADSRINLIKKPFYCLPIVNILNSKTSFKIDEFEIDDYFICPGVRVLVVDDEPMNLMVAEGIFKDYQMKVKTAEGGIEAIEICRKEEFDLIFLDHMMPEMDGIETLKMLRKIQMDTGKVSTIIAFTANAVSGAREMFLKEGFDEFISKPIEDHELKRLLKKVLPKASIAYKTDRHGAVSENDPKEDKLTKLEKKGVHTGAGLQYCRGDVEFYEKVLVKFANDAEHKIIDIEDALQKEDIKNYQIMAHALKSSSKMIGANMLSEMAKAAEDAAKNQDVSYINENHAGLIGKYRETVKDILDVLAPDEETVSEESSVTVTEVSKDELLQGLSKLKKSLDTFEADVAETLLGEMNGLVYMGTPVSELLHDIIQDVEEFELGDAAKKAEALIISMEGGGL